MQLARLAVFALLGAAAYSSSLDAFFVSDDFNILRALKEGGPFGLWTVRSGFFRPLASWSLWVDLQAWGLSSAGFRATQLLLHVGCAVLVARVAEQVAGLLGDIDEGADSREMRQIGWLAGLFFLLHPSHSEAVAWISARPDVLATLLALVALVAYLQFDWGRWRVLLVVFALLGGAASKEAALTMPWVLLAWESTARGRPRRGQPRRVALLALLALLPLLLVAARGLFVGSAIGGYGSAIHLRVDSQALAGPIVLYPLRSFLPPLRSDPLSIVCFLATAGVMALALARLTRRARPALATGELRILAALAASAAMATLPVLNLGVSLRDSGGERLLYLPSVFASLLLAFLLGAALSRRWRVWAAAAYLAPATLALVLSVGRWGSAGDLAQALLRSALEVEASGKVLVLNQVDSLDGAYVYRNGFEDALRLYGGPDPWRPMHLVRHAVRTVGREASIIRDCATVTLSLSEPRSVRAVINPRNWSAFVVEERPEMFRVVGQERGRLTVELVAAHADRPLLYSTGSDLRWSEAVGCR